jgi:hypothetical protein
MLHGARVTSAAATKREAVKSKHPTDNAAIAAVLGDRDGRVGAHYTRHIENAVKFIQTFPRPAKNPPRQEGFWKTADPPR